MLLKKGDVNGRNSHFERLGVNFPSVSVLSRERPMSRIAHYLYDWRKDGLLCSMWKSNEWQHPSIKRSEYFTLLENLSKKVPFSWIGVEGYLTPVG
ncbi:MAG TPA: hypothetical protein DEB37_19045 [Lysinibacillus sp.]|nr:hypothetical protein [Lysinibacillus sp.]